MLAGVVVSTGAVWTWGDIGLEQVVVAPPLSAPASPPPPPVGREPAAAAAAAKIVGAAVVEATNVLVVDNRRLVLAGVMPVNHHNAIAALRGFLDEVGPVGCREAAAGTWTCEGVADGGDIGEIAVLSGLAFTGPGAPQRYVDAEKTAKQRKSGIWGNS